MSRRRTGQRGHLPPPSRLSRRLVLSSGGIALFGLGAGAPLLDRMARAAAQGSGASDRILVVVFQRGAMDGLMAVQPVADRELRRMRGDLFLSATGDGPAIDLDNGFALHPAFDPLLPLWRENQLAVVHGTGSPHPTRSHFDAQDYMETAVVGLKSGADGFLNRVSRRLAGRDEVFGTVSLGASAPRMVEGVASTLVIDDLERFRMPRALSQGRMLESLYRETDDALLRSRGSDLFDALRVLDAEELKRHQAERQQRYPASRLGRSLMQIAYLIRRRMGLRIAFAESPGWDTHAGQGVEQGAFAALAGDLADSLAAFWRDLGDDAERVTVLTLTEFGRTVAQNGSGGTDHGHGSCMMLLGPTVQGGQIHGTLPTLVPENLYEGRDLPVTTDFRAVLADVVEKTFGVRDDPFLFPGWQGLSRPVLWG